MAPRPFPPGVLQEFRARLRGGECEHPVTAEVAQAGRGIAECRDRERDGRVPGAVARQVAGDRVDELVGPVGERADEVEHGRVITGLRRHAVASPLPP